MSLIIARVAPNGRMHTATYQGAPHLVVPVIALVAGVVNGILAPAAVIQASVRHWNGVPVLVGHPTDSTGQALSAYTSPAIAEGIIGRLMNCTYTQDRLRGELWMNLTLAASMGEAVQAAVTRLQAGHPLEVSTGFFAPTSPQTGTYDGRPYTGVYTDIRPDHLALLPDAVGACSWDDGCGAPRVAQADPAPEAVPSHGGAMLITDTRITTLVQRGHCDTEAHRQALAALPEPLLVALCAAATPAEPPTQTTTAPPKPEPEPDPEPEPEPAPQTLEAVLGMITDKDLQETISQGVATLKTQKAALIKTLTDSHCPFPLVHLQAQPLTVLEGYRAMMGLTPAGPVSYLGQGGAQPVTAADDLAAWLPQTVLSRATS